jgi:hypothetical protein
MRDIWKSSFKDSSAKVLWIGVILLLPLFGSIAYLQNRKNLKAGRRWTKENDDVVF